MKNTLFLPILILGFLAGCATPEKIVWTSFPTVQVASNEFFDAEIVPVGCGGYGCKAFGLTVKNKAESPRIWWRL